MHPAVDCYDVDYYPKSKPTSNAAGCARCPACMDCTGDKPIIEIGFETFDAPTTSLNSTIGDRQAVLKCPVPEACLQKPLATKGATELNRTKCATGHVGPLCQGCADGFRKGTKGVCRICETEGANPLFLIPFLAVIVYVGFRALLGKRRKERDELKAQAREIFNELDLDGSGEISRKEMQHCLKELGHEVDKMTAVRIFDHIDLDRSGGISVHEFEAWMSQYVSQTKMYIVVAKILFGLFQVLSRQPETVKEDFPGEQWDEFKLFSFDFAWSMPICSINYYGRWIFNAVLLPLFLLGLVEFTWQTEKYDWWAIVTRKDKGCSKKQQYADDSQPLDEHLSSHRLRDLFRDVSFDAAPASSSADLGQKTLSRDDVGKILARLGNKLTDEHLASVMHEMDLDGDGRASFNELQLWLNVKEGVSGVDERQTNINTDRYFAFFLCCASSRLLFVLFAIL